MNSLVTIVFKNSLQLEFYFSRVPCVDEFIVLPEDLENNHLFKVSKVVHKPSSSQNISNVIVHVIGDHKNGKYQKNEIDTNIRMKF